MQREFLDLYERELNALYDRAADFAAEFPGLADRLGGLARDRLDPGLAGLLEGTAFLAARAAVPEEQPEQAAAEEARHTAARRRAVGLCASI